jgi:anti-sigma regulatory factor (Ser/Thr protein kinase)
MGNVMKLTFPDHYSGSSAKHQALFFSSEDEFVSTFTPFVTEGIGAGHVVLTVATRDNMQALRDVLGPQQGVFYIDADDWYRNPSLTLHGYHSFVEDHVRRGAPAVRIIGQVVWKAHNARHERAWARYESSINALLSDLPAWIVCPYDVTRLSPSVIATARATHPELVDHGHVDESDGYVAADQLFAGTAPNLSMPALADVRRFRAMDVGAAAMFVESSARRAGLREVVVQNLVASASDLVMNAFVHAGTDVHIGTWIDERDLVVQVEDEGDGLPDPLAGYVPPGPQAPDGWGLWLARQRSDELEIGRGMHGQAFRLRVWADRRTVETDETTATPI